MDNVNKNIANGLGGIKGGSLTWAGDTSIVGGDYGIITSWHIPFPIPQHNVKVYKADANAELPEYGTEFSSCFDIKACLTPGVDVKYWNKKNVSGYMDVTPDGTIYIDPGERVLVPTGLIFDLEEWQDFRIQPRSSIAAKHGVSLANAEGIIDPDYVNETFILLHNYSKVAFKITHGERLAQGDIHVRSRTTFEVVTEKPTQKTDRVGGVGSTGR